MLTATYQLEHLHCAHCASVIEEKLNTLPEVEKATLIFATKKLNIQFSESYLETKENISAAILHFQERLQHVIDGIENGVIVRLPVERKMLSAPTCSCGEGHHHDHSHSSHGRWAIAEIGIAFLLLVLGHMLDLLPTKYAKEILLFTYLVVGRNVLLLAGRNILRGRVTDENLLMGIATIGAIAIGEVAEALGVMVFYRIGQFFEDRATEKSRQEVMSIVDLRPETVILVEANGTRIVPAEEVLVGQVVQVRAGDRIPLDGVVRKGTSQIDTSPITGESVPIRVGEGSEIISGTVNITGTLEIEVKEVLATSMVTKILDAVENAAANKPKMDRLITRFSRYYTPTVLVIAFLVAIIPSLVTGNWEYWLYTALTFLVISCPCALVLSVPLTFFSGIGAGSKAGVLFKGGVALESLDRIKVIAMDKTGTITKGEFKVTAVDGYDALTSREVLALAASVETVSSHPIAKSIIAAAHEEELKLLSVEEAEEVAGEGIRAQVAGEEVLVGNDRLLNKYGILVPESKSGCVATLVYVLKAGVLVGRVAISDTLKDGAKEATSRLQKEGYVVAMLTGDREPSARDIAEKIGITEVFAKLLPQEKLSVLTKLREKYGPVMFVGDGINDSPVLAGADVGAAMGSGADAAIEAADAVFMTSEMEAVPKALELAKKTIRVAWQNVIFAIAVKVLIMSLGLIGYASMWAAVFADTGVTILCVMNAIRILYVKY